jgi:hypothetical protein
MTYSYLSSFLRRFFFLFDIEVDMSAFHFQRNNKDFIFGIVHRVVDLERCGVASE